MNTRSLDNIKTVDAYNSKESIETMNKNTTTATTNNSTTEKKVNNSAMITREARNMQLDALKLTRAQTMREYIEKAISERKIERFFFNADNNAVFYKDNAQVVELNFSRTTNRVADRIQIHFRRTNVYVWIGNNTNIETRVIDAYEHHSDNIHEREFHNITDEIIKQFVDDIIEQCATVKATETATTEKKKATTAKKTTAKKATTEKKKAVKTA